MAPTSGARKVTKNMKFGEDESYRPKWAALDSPRYELRSSEQRGEFGFTYDLPFCAELRRLRIENAMLRQQLAASKQVASPDCKDVADAIAAGRVLAVRRHHGVVQDVVGDDVGMAFDTEHGTVERVYGLSELRERP